MFYWVLNNADEIAPSTLSAQKKYSAHSNLRMAMSSFSNTLTPCNFKRPPKIGINMTDTITEFENSGYIVRSFIPDEVADIVIVSFTGVGAPERQNGSFFGEPLAKALNMPFIGLIAKSDSWYLEDGIDDAIGAIKVILDRIRRNAASFIQVIGYGISMGGFGVIKHSKALGLDALLSLAPQWSIDSSETGRKSSFSGYYQHYMQHMGPRASDVAIPSYIFYDPRLDEERAEAESFSQIPTVVLVPVAHAGHMVTNSLKGSKNFQELLNAVLRGEDILSITKIIRNKSKENVYNIILKCLEKKIDFFPLALSSKRSESTGAKEFIVANHKEAWRAIATLFERGQKSSAFKLAHILAPRDLLFPSFTKILAWTGEFIVYNPLEKTFSQTEHHHITQGELVVVINGSIYSLSATGLMKLPYSTEFSEDSFVIRAADGKALSARENGKIGFTEWVARWEKFTTFD